MPSRPKRKTLKKTIKKNISKPKILKFKLGLTRRALRANAAALKELKKVDTSSSLAGHPKLNLNRVYAALSRSDSRTTGLDSPLDDTKKFTNHPTAHEKHPYPPPSSPQPPPEKGYQQEDSLVNGMQPKKRKGVEKKGRCSLMGGKKTRKKRKRRRKTRHRTKRRVKKHRKRKTLRR